MGFGLDLAHRIDQFAAHQVKRRFGVDNRIVKGIRQNLGGPDEARLDALEEKQLNHPKQQRARTHE